MLSKNKEQRKEWEVINNSNFSITVGDLPKVPAILPGKKCNILRYYSEEACSQSSILLSLIKTQKLKLTKIKDGNRDKITSSEAERCLISIGLCQNYVDSLFAYVKSEENKIGKIRKVSTGDYVTAGADIEYYSPEQHGGLYGGNIYRKYFIIPDCPSQAATVVIPHGVSIDVLVSFNGLGVVKLQSDTDWYMLPHSDFGGGSRNIEVVVNQTNIDLVAGAEIDWRAGGFIYIDYTKV